MATTIWLTDRSRYELALDRCQRARYLNTSWGPSGYGIARKAHSIPLAAGTYYHEGLAVVAKYVCDTDELPPDSVVRNACTLATDAYKQVVKARGMAGLDEGQRLETVVAEQCCLIEGLIWAFTLSVLPWIHEQATIIQVERDDVTVLGCTCGLGDFIGTLEEHEARDCEGIGFQYRLDFLTDYRARPGVLAYWEFKGTAATGERFDTQWETSPQFALGAMMEAKRRETHIQEAWVIGLIKGRREGDTYNPETKKREGDLRQQSPLCYGWQKPANPPFEEEDWQAEYEYRDEMGKNHRLGKAYQKQGVWTFAGVLADSPVSPSEFWCKWMPSGALAKQIALVGPLQVSEVISGEIIEEIIGEEQRWKGIVWELHQALEECEYDWTAPGYQAALRRLVQRSWSCRRFGKRYECQFAGICFEREGWQDPLAGEQFIVRRPHHAAELQQMTDRGLTPPEGWAEDEIEEGGF